MVWEHLVRSAQDRDVAPEAVLREEIQKACLAHLSLRGFFKEHVFQGGTALRLVYGSPRYSEDLDFVLLRDTISTEKVDVSALKRFLGSVFPYASVEVREQKHTPGLHRYAVRVSVTELRKSVRINLEIAGVPSRDNEVLLFAYPPFNPAVRVETQREILADKLVALALRKYVKGRDLWDIYFLVKQKGLTADIAFAEVKAGDYGCSKSEFHARLKEGLRRVATDGCAVLAREMPRFLPRSVLQLYAYSGWAEVTEAVLGLV